MKQKQVKTAAKAVTPAKKASTPRKVKEVINKIEEEEAVVEKKLSKISVTKKPAKFHKKIVKVVAAEPESEEEVEDVEVDEEEGDDEDEEMNDDEELEVEEDDDDDGGDNEDDEENDDDDDENDDDEDAEDDDEDAEDDDDDADAPSEEDPTIPSAVKSGPIHPSVPISKIIHISNLPKKCKQITIVEAFAKYGAIDQIHIKPSMHGLMAYVAFKTEKAAAAAAEIESVKVKNSTVKVSMKREHKKKPTVFVKYLSKDTTEEQLKEHFAICGDIESINLKTKYSSLFAFVVFVDESSIPAALKLNNSLLNGNNIRVAANEKGSAKDQINENLSVVVRNKQNFQNIDVTKLEAIFSKCGEIDNIITVCKKNVLAFITFKKEDAVQKAVQLSGTTEEDIQLDVELYDQSKKWTCIHVSNIPRDCNVEDLTKIFSKAGEIMNVQIKKSFAIIRFADSDGYCKSFLYNESYIRGNIIFVEPHSFRKQSVYNKSRKSFQKKGFKRPAENGSNSFKYNKKPKT